MVQLRHGSGITVILTNVPYGYDDVYLHGHRNADELNGRYQLVAGWHDYGTLSTTNTTEWSSDVWTEGTQLTAWDLHCRLLGDRTSRSP